MLQIYITLLDSCLILKNLFMAYLDEELNSEDEVDEEEENLETNDGFADSSDPLDDDPFLEDDEGLFKGTDETM